ncbi:MAG TPA: fibrillarin-like rRNA/tRNA 2'-O-methyltransferase [Thermoplasmata archaeon]|nr:fibrillarin-like rRNA/tRNA 2'-O-methyltransferase [Thermoplasmata archaeon]
MPDPPLAHLLRRGRDLYTENAIPGERVYGEALIRDGDREFRAWDPFRSKLAAFLLNGGAPSLLDGVRKVLYLGASHGTTASHLSDLLPEAEIFLIERSPVSFAPLLALARRRTNLLPILADAQLPERYAADVGEVDLLYQDVAQRGQARIFRENASACLAPRGVGLLLLKVRSVSQSRSARSVLQEARGDLALDRLTIRETIDLAPFSRDHLALRIDR